MWFSTLLFFPILFTPCLALRHTFYYTVTPVTASPDGVHPKTVIGLNGTWPWPEIHVNRGDQVELYLTNGLAENTSIHFHGLFQRGSNAMDGPEHVTQCPIPPNATFLYNFTVDQAGTYWYHSHSSNQYLDGFRGPFIVHEKEEPFEYDEEVVFTISDWYHQQHQDLLNKFLNKYNPTGAEPVPQNMLFNELRNVLWHVQPNTTYLARIVSVSGFASQYVWLEDHEFVVVEVDGVYVEPVSTDMLYVTAGQRYGVLIKSKETQPQKNYRFMQALDPDMLDVIPPDLELVAANWMVYDQWQALPGPMDFDPESAKPLEDFGLVPLAKTPLLPEPDLRIQLDVEMINLANGVNYAFFNNITYVAPKVPTLATVLSAPEELVFNPEIYGANTHPYVLQANDVVEIIINNHDDGKHPFHLHGHVFQVIQKSEEFDDPVDYNPEEHSPFPDYPVQRDTVQVQGNGYLVLRFRADNPGVWFFHCHVEWHLEQGLAVTFVEDPLGLRQQSLNQNYKDVCAAGGCLAEGNAAGNTDFLDLGGANQQPKWLPEGFTGKGYFAMLICVCVALYGLYTIHVFGSETEPVDNEEIIQNLKEILEKNGVDLE